MKPAPFQYFAPRSLQEALNTLHTYGDEARLLSGGQSLIASMNFRCLRPSAIIDLNRVAGLDGLSQQPDGEVRIGALNRHRTLEFHPLIEKVVPLIHEAVPYIAHPPIRTRGTIGGSLAYADPAAELPAVTLALGARYKAARQGGDRWIPAEEFFTNMFFTELAADEVLVEVAIPPLPPRTGAAIVESARRQGDRVMMGVVAVVTLDGTGACQSARLVYMNAAPTPILAVKTAGLLAGQTASAELFEAAAHACQDEIDPTNDAHASKVFRRHLADELTRRALSRAFGRASGERVEAGSGRKGHG